MELLTIVWQDINQEFSNISGGNRAELWMVKTKRLQGMQLDYQRHAGIIRLIKIFPHVDLIKLANEEGYAISLDDFHKTFEKAYTRLMRMKNQIGIFQKDSEPEESNQSLDETIVMLEKFQGYQFDEHKMSVKKFANILKKYKDG